MRHLTLSITFVCFVTATVAGQLPSGETRRPNVLWIMADQLRADGIGANGNKIIQTPAIDALAKGSANFTRAFVQSPVCVPSRASFFTGRYPHSHRNRVNYTPLKADEVLLPARLQAAGYRTAMVGKLHLYYRYPPTPEEARRTGFDLVDLHDAAGETDPWSDYIKWRQANDPMRDIPHRKLARQVPSLRSKLPAGTNPYRAAIDEKYSETTWTGVRTRERMKELAGGNKPFFLFCSFWKPHSPYEVCAPFDSMYNDAQIPLPAAETKETIGRLPLPVQKLILRGRPEYLMDRSELEWAYRSYYGTISHVDREIGLILGELKELGLMDRTIVVFTSDHGDQLLEHGLLGKNVFFEASVRVPLVIGYPGHVRAGRHEDLVEAVDVLPTLFDLIGLPQPGDCQGRSVAGLIGEAGRALTQRDAVFSENIIPEVITNRTLDFYFKKGEGVKGIRHPDAKMVRTTRWKYNYYPEGFEELYDLEADPGEQHNLAGDRAHEGTIREMKDRLLKWLVTADEADQIAPRWMVP